MSEPVEPPADDAGRPRDDAGRPQEGGTASPRAGRPDADGRPGDGPATPAGDHAAAERERQTPVDEPSGAQGTGGTGTPVSDEPGVEMPKPTEHPERVRREAEPEPAPEPEPAGGRDGPEAGGPAPQAPAGWLPRGAEELFGPGATAEFAYELLTVDVPAERWIVALETARDDLGCTYFDWLSAVDEPGEGFRICAHVAALPSRPGEGVRRLVVRTTVPHEDPVLPTATAVYAGAAWHERETHEMFGVGFTGHPHLAPLLLPDGFEGHPLRKDFVLAARVAKAWPGAKEPGESGHGGPKRRQMLPPGVPDPNEWGPLKGTLPPTPSRPARGRAAAGGDRPARRTRSASTGSTGRRATETESPAETPGPPRRARSASGGSASQRESGAGEASTGGAEEASAPRPARRSRSASGGSASQREPGAGEASTGGAEEASAPRPARRSRSASGGSASQREPRAGETPASDDAAGGDAAPSRSADAPWHHARPAFDASGGEDAPTADAEPRAARDEGDEGDREPAEQAEQGDRPAAESEPRDGETGGER